MTQFRKKPVVIDAVQWDPRQIGKPMPFGAHQEAHGNNAYIDTANGRVVVEPGDWICVQMVNGRPDVWPCKADVFAATYEAVE